MTNRDVKFLSIALMAAIALLIATASAIAASYPVSGKWTYDNADADGPAKDCGKRFMNFQGEQRFDTGGGVPGYRNFSIQKNGDEYSIVDQFSTGQITARSNYTLRKIDEDHLEIRLSGKTIKLRRCE